MSMYGNKLFKAGIPTGESWDQRVARLTRERDEARAALAKAEADAGVPPPCPKCGEHVRPCVWTGRGHYLECPVCDYETKPYRDLADAYREHYRSARKEGDDA